MKIKLLVILFILNSALSSSNEIVMAESDFLLLVGKFHPVAKQAQLQIDIGRSNLLRAGGAFDPFISAQYSNKIYEDKSYYEIINSGLKIPIWFGPDINFGYEKSAGNYLNPERNLPNQGLLSAGIKMPLGQGLFIDNRRAAFRQAEIFGKLSEVEQVRILADLYFSAVSAYWDWSADYSILKLSTEILSVANERYEGIRQSFFQGDIPAIDTVEAYLQILNLDINLQSARNEFVSSSLYLSNFLWNENMIPMEINDNLIPDTNSELTLRPVNEILPLTQNIDSLIAIHPELQVYSLKLEELAVERRLKLEYLKPKLDLKYDYLNNAGNVFPNEIFPDQNFKVELDFNMPVFLRQGRGELQLTDIKIIEAELQFEAKKLELLNKVNSYLNEISILYQQFSLFSQALENYRILLEGEQIKFNAGESSLFLLNSRENSLLNANIKQIELFTKINTKIGALRWSLGTIGRVQ
ncbi:MAG: TolC family protein [Candidatus Kapabacteria bacterium]|nr:TolC family protein [Ignavibacteriota bacterium]MCW5885105.1 TolC family protein [Candidatus Kapabacteria bacterium]